MRRAGDLFERVASFSALVAAGRRVLRGRRSSPSMGRLWLDLEGTALALERELRAGTWVPGAPTTFLIRDPKPRRISAPPVRDRVVHHALCAAVEPVFERVAIDDSYACRPGKGVHAAVRRVQAFSRAGGWYARLDVRHYFETVPQDLARRLVARLIKDRAVLDLFDRILSVTPEGSEPGRGLPIGALTSQHVANLCLLPLDRFIKQDLRVRRYARFMDDMVLFAEDKAGAKEAARRATDLARDSLGLTMRADAARLAPVHVGVPFLGFRIAPRQIRLDAARVRRLRRHMRAVDDAWRTGADDEERAARRASSLIGWAELADTRTLRADWMTRRAGGAP